MKKKISLLTIIFIILSALIAILGLFSVIDIEGIVANLLFSSLTLSIAGLLTLNSCALLEKKNKLALVSLLLITVSSALVIIGLWSNITSIDLYKEITITICVLSIHFNLIVSYVLKLQNRHIATQVLTYICFSIVAFFLINVAWDTHLTDTCQKTFILFIILSLLSIGVLSALSKRIPNNSISNFEYIQITKQEYNELLRIKTEYLKTKGHPYD